VIRGAGKVPVFGHAVTSRKLGTGSRLTLLRDQSRLSHARNDPPGNPGLEL
jgi:hypothetical protein